MGKVFANEGRKNTTGRRILVAILALTLCLLSAATALAGNNKASKQDLLSPNNGAFPSIDSKLVAPPPCSGAGPLYPIWRKAGRFFGVDWAILAAITKIESGLGCNMGPSSAGAIGWTQFLPSTWERWGMDADGDGKADPYNAVDAIFSTARYLRVTGAPDDYYSAIYAYNHADWYVREVLTLADQFRGAGKRFHVLAGIGLNLSTAYARATDAQERYDDVSAELRRQRRRLRNLRRQMADLKRVIERNQRLAELLQKQYEQSVADYVSVASALAARPDLPAGGQDQALSVVAGVRSQRDAVLVYAGASSLFERQSALIAAIREKGRQLDAKIASLQNDRELLASKTLALQDNVNDLKVKEHEARRALQEGLRAARMAARLARQLGNSADALTGGSYIPDVAANGWQWPISGPVTGVFGEPRPGHIHQGVDIAAPTGAPVAAAADGVVKTAGAVSGYGNLVVIGHKLSKRNAKVLQRGLGLSVAPRLVETYYAHLSEIDVRLGDRVNLGDVIGKIGCTGHCFGPHLHFEFRIDGKSYDPQAGMTALLAP